MLDDFLKDNSVITIHLESDTPSDAGRRANDERPAQEYRMAGEEAAQEDRAPVEEVAPSERTSDEGVTQDDPVVDEEVVPALVQDESTSVEEAVSAPVADDVPDDIASPTSVPVVDPRRSPRVNPVNLNSETDKYGIYQDAVSSSNTLGIGLVMLLFAIALIIALWVGFGFLSDQAKEQGAQTLRDSIVDASMQCFAIEGYYPPSLEYLQDNYGLSVNENDYVVVYVAFASNVPPSVDVRMR